MRKNEIKRVKTRFREKCKNIINFKKKCFKNLLTKGAGFDIISFVNKKSKLYGGNHNVHFYGKSKNH